MARSFEANAFDVQRRLREGTGCTAPSERFRRPSRGTGTATSDAVPYIGLRRIGLERGIPQRRDANRCGSMSLRVTSCDLCGGNGRRGGYHASV
jgi:hypothetical protein